MRARREVQIMKHSAEPSSAETGPNLVAHALVMPGTRLPWLAEKHHLLLPSSEAREANAWTQHETPPQFYQ